LLKKATLNFNFKVVYTILLIIYLPNTVKSVKLGRNALSTKEASGNIEELGKKLDQILRRLDLIEELILEKHEYAGLTAALQITRAGMGIYGEPLKIASRLKTSKYFFGKKMLLMMIFLGA
jgi:hypothetical protein